jgi:hypothetical protein
MGIALDSTTGRAPRRGDLVAEEGVPVRKSCVNTRTVNISFSRLAVSLD